MKTRHDHCKRCITELCKKENLCFLIKVAGQKPALYFLLGNLICNIKQEHADGSKISLYTNNRFSLFFYGPDTKKKLTKEVRNLPELAEKENNISMVPQNGWQVLIYSTSNKRPDGKVENNRLFPPGVVQMEGLQKITQDEIDRIIANIDELECDNESMMEHWFRRIGSLQQAVKENHASKKRQLTAPDGTLVTKGSTGALLEVLSYARLMLTDLNNNDSQHDSDNDITELEKLSRGNELLRKKLSELDQLMKDKL